MIPRHSPELPARDAGAHAFHVVQARSPDLVDEEDLSSPLHQPEFATFEVDATETEVARSEKQLQLQRRRRRTICLAATATVLLAAVAALVTYGIVTRKFATGALQPKGMKLTRTILFSFGTTTEKVSTGEHWKPTSLTPRL